MSAKEDAIRAFKALLGKYQERMEIAFALTGNGTGSDTADVASRTGWAWVRYGEEQSKVSQVFNPTFPGIPEGVPVIIGKRYPTNKYVEILGINQQMYWENYNLGTIQGYLVPAHGQSHNASGSDPAPIDIKNIVPGLTHQTDPDSMFVTVEGFRYIYQTGLADYVGENVDLSAVAPAAGFHQYVLIAMIPATGAIRTTASAAVALPIVPDIPDLTAGDIPLSVVDVRSGENIVNAYIYDYRALFQEGGGGGSIFGVVAKAADYTATDSDYTILVTCSIADITITLPAAADNTGRTYNIKKVDATAWTVIVDGNAGELIDGAATQTIIAQYDSLQIQCDGTGWYII